MLDHMGNGLKPKPRTALRLAAGKRFYTWRRYIEWLFDHERYASGRSAESLPHRVMAHDTPTLRQLKDVEMRLQYNKEINLRLAIARLDGTVLNPGETFSYWKLIGKPSRRRGYVPGLVLFYGGFRAGIGGGLCQLSNLIYWMTLHTPLNVIERHRHSYDVFPDANRTQPFGSGATCSYNYLDLRIRNDTQHAYQLRLELRDHRLYGMWLSDGLPVYRYEIYERSHRIMQAYWGGYVRQNVIGRRTRNLQGELIADEAVAENRALMMYSPLLQEASADEAAAKRE